MRVGVVESQVGFAAELLSEAEVEADGLGVTDVEVAVGLGREAGLDDGVAETVSADVFGDLVAEEVGERGSFGGAAFGFRSVMALIHYPTGKNVVG